MRYIPCGGGVYCRLDDEFRRTLCNHWIVPCGGLGYCRYEDEFRRTNFNAES